jgi:hypothetical protein
MTYVRSGFGQPCDSSTMVTSVNGNYQCCPTDTNCINEAGLPSGTAPAPSGSGVDVGLQYGQTPPASTFPWWGWLLVALGIGTVASLATGDA